MRIPSRTPSRTPLRPAFRVPLRSATLGAALLGAAVLTGATATPAAAVPREVNQGYVIPVGGITDLGALPVLGSLGMDFARLLGQP
ncbi:hypothetical protein ABT263_31480 [Kitasatospora sp. NPDC001603]|uniref:hypothetical protein n=1 Tax=Kitasatospora sp. NPDC001603 TaxID=3154388 RepID=UPI003321F57F